MEVKGFLVILESRLFLHKHSFQQSMPYASFLLCNLIYYGQFDENYHINAFYKMTNKKLKNNPKL